MKKPKSGALRTSEILIDLRNSCDSNRKITVGDFTEKLSDRAYGLAIFIFGIINGLIPGVSIIFSIPVLFIGIQMILGHRQIWLPKWLARKTFSESLLRPALNRTIPVLRLLERFIQPRLHFLTTDIAERFIALILITLAFVVFLPLPGLNFVPAICMCILALGILERDGLLIFLGSIFSIGGIIFMSLIILTAMAKLYEYISDFSF